ncbi:MAG: aspartyl/glutamyl-tRNA amidotransferase subunit C [Elusimicrobiaceae bacterium]|nr:aspartyl/glutamyl-tRNA amidotransferase subunit C [Elusimicrobiaceae bacterium]
MILEKDNVSKCAAMTKIRLNAGEAEMYENELKDLFRWVEELSKVDTSAVPETSIGHAAYLRPDEPVVNEKLADTLVGEFNEQQGHCAKVKKVL